MTRAFKDRVYISGPISLGGRATDVSANLAKFDEAHDALLACSYLPVSPNMGQRTGWSWSDYMRACLALLLTCDGVALLPGWHLSKGARVERDVAISIGLRVAPLHEWLEP